MPWLVRLLLVLLASLAAWGVGDLAYVTLGAEKDYAARADVIILLGCSSESPDGGPSECIKARADHAAYLYKQGLASYIIATGGPDDGGPVEADVMEQTLEADGVPARAIVKERRARNTIQNISYSLEIMQKSGWRSAILVTEPYHINRAALIARDAGLLVYPSPAVDSPIWRNPEKRYLKLARDTLSLILYQLKVATGNKE